MMDNLVLRNHSKFNTIMACSHLNVNTINSRIHFKMKCIVNIQLWTESNFHKISLVIKNKKVRLALNLVIV